MWILKNSKDLWKIIIYPTFDFSPLYISIPREDFNSYSKKSFIIDFTIYKGEQHYKFIALSYIVVYCNYRNSCIEQTWTNKVHICEYSQVYNMTENLTFEQYFENNCVQRGMFYRISQYTQSCVSILYVY
jgi:hypothetical protein